MTEIEKLRELVRKLESENAKLQANVRKLERENWKLKNAQNESSWAESEYLNDRFEKDCRDRGEWGIFG